METISQTDLSFNKLKVTPNIAIRDYNLRESFSFISLPFLMGCVDFETSSESDSNFPSDISNVTLDLNYFY